MNRIYWDKKEEDYRFRQGDVGPMLFSIRFGERVTAQERIAICNEITKLFKPKIEIQALE